MKTNLKCEETASKAKEKYIPTKETSVSRQQTPRLLEQRLKRDEMCQRMESNKFSSVKEQCTEHFLCFFASSSDSPRLRLFLFRALTDLCLEIRKSQPFVSPELPRACRPASYHFLCCRCRNDPPSLVEFCDTYMALQQLYVILLFNYTVNISS